ncbi:hypothetical protein [Streptomyces sp. CC210A]|uniref:hypothetical protein n=1 Tax=Streptomyces sp. CC210A TaxID=2898184 RepID=UPI001F429AC0|nr:hypothetical protein [Streptomyces sp. CC210A]
MHLSRQTRRNATKDLVGKKIDKQARINRIRQRTAYLLRHRRIRGIAAQAILLAFHLAHANKRTLATRAGSIALHGNHHPHRRPTRRCKTKPLGTRSPEGHLTETTA